MAPSEAYAQLIAFLDRHRARYRLIDHPPEGRTDIVSPMRGNALSQAAKCIILMVKIGKKETRYVLGVVPGDARVDLGAVKALMSGTYVAFASAEVAAQLAGSVAGTILPFAFNPELELIVDPSLLENDEIYFNAGRLDRSMALKTSDYVALAEARLATIAEGRSARPGGAPILGDGPVTPALCGRDEKAKENTMTEQAPYSIHLEPAFGPLELVDVQALANACQDRWYNQTLCRVNDCVVRLGVMQGEFHWHQHDREDEFFYVVEGRFVIDLEGRTVELRPRQGFTVPKGVTHRTRAPERSVILMIEGAGVVPTGDATAGGGTP